MYYGREQIRSAYRNETVARDYVADRFIEPMGALLHRRQIDVVLRAIQDRRQARVVEIAPGPARLTADIARRGYGGLMIDASAEMLSQARNRMPADPEWHVVQGDAFALPVRSAVDLVYSFRLIRHFEADDRALLYAEIARILVPGGLLIFDAVNERVSAPLRAASPAHFAHYDALLTPRAIATELSRAGFTLMALVGVQHRFKLQHMVQILVGPRSRRLAGALIQILESTGGEPLEWVVVARRN